MFGCTFSFPLLEKGNRAGSPDKLASPADVLRGSSRVLALRTSEGEVTDEYTASSLVPRDGSLNKPRNTKSKAGLSFSDDQRSIQIK